MQKATILIIEYLHTGASATLINIKGERLAEGFHSMKIAHPKPHWDEFNPLESIFSVRSAINDMFQKTKVQPQEVDAIGIITTGQGALVWDAESGFPFYEGIYSSCKRMSSEIFTLQNGPVGKHILEKTGLAIEEGVATHWKWIIENCPEAKIAMQNGKASVGTMDTWLIYNLTGRSEHLTDVTHAFQTQMVDLESLTWDDFLMQEFLIHEDSLPIITQSAAIFGKTDGFLPLPDDIPILGIAKDTAAEILGANGSQFQESALMLGKQGQLSINTGVQLYQGFSEAHPVILSFTKDVRYGLEGGIPFPVGMESIFRKPLEQYLQEGNLADIVLNRADTSTINILPYYDDEQQLMSSIVGITKDTTQNDVIRAYFEAIAFSTRYSLDTLQKEVDLYPRELKVIGPFVEHDFLLQLLANILQLQVVRLKGKESKYIAMSFLIGKMLGIYTGEMEASKLVRVEKMFLPEIDPITSQSIYTEWCKHRKAVVIS